MLLSFDDMQVQGLIRPPEYGRSSHYRQPCSPLISCAPAPLVAFLYPLEIPPANPLISADKCVHSHFLPLPPKFTHLIFFICCLCCHANCAVLAVCSAMLIVLCVLSVLPGVCSGSVHAVRSILREEGMLALYKVGALVVLTTVVCPLSCARGAYGVLLLMYSQCAYGVFML